MSEITMLPLRDQAAVGVKVTLIVQEEPAAIEVQLLVWVKSPLATMPMTVRLEVPELVTVMVFAELFLPTVTPLKLRLTGDKVAAAPTPVPLKEAV